MNAKVIAIANLKGGVGKTTTALSLGAELTQRGYRILLVDADDNNQSLTQTIGVTESEKRKTLTNLLIYDCFEDGGIDEQQVMDTVIECVEGFDLLPSDQKLAGISTYLAFQSYRGDFGSEGILFHLKSILDRVRNHYDYIIVDTGANHSQFFLNVLVASDEIIIPAQAQKMSDNGTMETLRAIEKIKKNHNAALVNKGILITMVDNRTRYSKDKAGRIENEFTEMGLCVFRSTIPRTIKGEEYAESGKSILAFAGKSKMAEAYRDFVAEYLEGR